MPLPLPHPNKAAVDAGTVGALKFTQDMNRVPREDRLTLAELEPMRRHVFGTCALEVLTPAYPHIGAQVAHAIATALDEAGEHAAATRVSAIANSWVAVAVPDDISGLL